MKIIFLNVLQYLLELSKACTKGAWLLIIMAFLCVFDVTAQDQKITIKEKNKPLSEILNQIESKTGYSFLVRSNDVDLKQKISIDVTNKSIKEVLTTLFKNNEINFEVTGKSISIFIPQNPQIKTNTTGEIRKISGIVSDLNGDPIIGASVIVKGTTKGTISDINGRFLLDVSANATLKVSYIGYIAKEVAVNNQKELKVSMSEDSKGLDEVVVVGYGTQKKGNLTGSVSSVNSEKLTIAPLSSTSNALGGQLPGLVAVQSSGQPGADAASLSIRGFGSALVIVDGIEASMNNLDPNQIESVSILKDGAASIYGARAGNGVILVTTKRGKDQKPTITLNSSLTYQGVTKMLKPTSSGQRAEMDRESWLQAGNPEATSPWTAEQVQKFYDGNDPLYPNTDWYKELIRDWAPMQQHNLSVRGGSDKIKYYGFLGYINQETMIKTNGGNYKKYNLQSNIDAKITEDLSLKLDISSFIDNNFMNARGMGVGGNMWQDYWFTSPRYPAHVPDPTKTPYADGAGTGGLHVTSNTDLSGYNKTVNQDFKGTISLNYNIKAIKGLSAKAFVNYYKSYSDNKNFVKPVNLYSFDPASDVYTLVGAFNTKASLGQTASNSSEITQQYSLNYDNTFGKDHHLNVLALYESINYNWQYISASRLDFLTPGIEQMFAGSTVGMSNGGSATEMGRKSFVGRLNYSYKDKYLFESVLRADASAKFPTDSRWGYFPSVSLGWVASQENFMKSIENLDNLKIRASYGQSGNDAVGDFKYLTGYAYGATYILGGAQQGLVSTGLANPYLTWERMSISNIGVDFSLFKRKLYGEADVFYRDRTGIPATKITTLPSTFGASLPPENINSLNDRGFELKLGSTGTINKFKYDISANISWSRSKWNHYEEPDYTDPDQLRIYKNSGNWTDRVYGYQSDGLFTDQSQIDALKFTYPIANSVLRVGDVKYIDSNEDGKLDWKDMVELGKGTTPHWMAGTNINLSYKGFDFTAFLQGAFGYYTYVNFDLPSTVRFDNRWTAANNNPDAVVPRLGGASTNSLMSDFYYKKAGYMRLKATSIGYNLPKVWLDKIGFSQLRLFISGTNLLTYSLLGKYGQDPEAPNNGSYYPQQRTFSFGFNTSF